MVEPVDATSAGAGEASNAVRRRASVRLSARTVISLHLCVSVCLSVYVVYVDQGSPKWTLGCVSVASSLDKEGSSGS